MFHVEHQYIHYQAKKEKQKQAFFFESSEDSHEFMICYF